MPPTETVELSNYGTILIAHEQDYRNSRGVDRQEIVQNIMKEIVAQSKGTLSKDTMKGLGKVSHLV